MKELKIILIILSLLILTVGCSNSSSESLEKMNDEYSKTIRMLEEEKSELTSSVEGLKEELKKYSSTLPEDFPKVYGMSEENLNNLVDEAIKICLMFNVGMSYDYNSMIEVDGVNWCKTSKFTSMKELEDYFLSIFVEDIVYDYYNIEEKFQEFDNVLYTCMLGEMGTLVSFSDKTPKLIRVNLHEQKLIYSKEYYDSLRSFEESKSSVFEIPIVYLEGEGFRLNSVINVY